MWNRTYQNSCGKAQDRQEGQEQYLFSLQQDALTDEEKPRRVKTADHVLQHIAQSAAFNFVAIDPCFSMLLRKQSKADLTKIANMGTRRKNIAFSYIVRHGQRNGKACSQSIRNRGPEASKSRPGGSNIVPRRPPRRHSKRYAT